jgi:hypothetical protein
MGFYGTYALEERVLCKIFQGLAGALRVNLTQYLNDPRPGGREDPGSGRGFA